MFPHRGLESVSQALGTNVAYTTSMTPWVPTRRATAAATAAEEFPAGISPHTIMRRDSISHSANPSLRYDHYTRLGKTRVAENVVNLYKVPLCTTSVHVALDSKLCFLHRR